MNGQKLKGEKVGRRMHVSQLPSVKVGIIKQDDDIKKLNQIKDLERKVFEDQIKEAESPLWSSCRGVVMRFIIKTASDRGFDIKELEEWTNSKE